MNPRLIKHAEWIVAILLSAEVLFFLFMRATHAGALWRDEAATLQMAELPTLSDIAANFQHEAFPIPFSITIRTYAALFSANDTALRWFGFVVGAALLGIAWLNSRTVGDRAPLLFLAFFGLNATFLTWGTSLRGYGLGCVLLLLTIGLTAKAISRPTGASAVFATIAAIASVQIMVNALPLIAAIAASAFAVFIWQRRFRRAAIVGGCVSICLLSFVPYAKAYLTADWNVVLKYPTDFFSLWEKFRPAVEEQGLLEGMFWYVAVPLIILGAIWHWHTLRRKASVEADPLLVLILISVLSILAYYGFLRILSYATRPWYYLPLLCAVAGAIDLMSGIWARIQSIRIGRLLVVIAALLLLPFTLWKSAQQRLTDIDLVAHKLEQEAGPSDLIVVNPWHFAPSFYRYYHGSTPWITVPTMDEHRVHRYDLMKSKMIQTDPLSDVRAAIQKTLQSGHRLWVVGGARSLDPDMPRLGPAPNPYFGWAGYMSFWSMEVGSFLNQHATSGEVVIKPMPGVNDGENVPLLLAQGWQD